MRFQSMLPGSGLLSVTRTGGMPVAQCPKPVSKGPSHCSLWQQGSLATATLQLPEKSEERPGGPGTLERPLRWRSSQLRFQPVRSQGSILVGDVVADMIAVLEHDEFRVVPDGANDLLSLLPRNDFVQPALDDKERLSYPGCDIFHGELAGLCLCLLRIAGARIVLEGKARQRRCSLPTLAKVVGTAQVHNCL